MPWIQRMPRRSGAKVRNWSESPFSDQISESGLKNESRRLVTNIEREGSTGSLLDQSVDCALNCLWRLSECPDERTPHPLAISKTVLPGNFLGGEAASLHHQPCRFDAQPFNCLRG